MVPDDVNFCPECGAPLTATGDVNMAANGATPASGFDTSGSNFSADSNTSVGSNTSSNVYRPAQNVHTSSTKAPRRKQSGLGIASAILAVLGCTSGLGLLLGIIDLVKNKNDGKKHGTSIFAVIWGGLITLAVIAAMFSEPTTEDYNNSSASDSRAIVESSEGETTEEAELANANDPNEASDISDEESEVAEEKSRSSAIQGVKKEVKDTEEAKEQPAEKIDLAQEIGSALSSELTKPETLFKASDYPEYKDEPYVEVNGNHPFFEDEVKKILNPESEVSDQNVQFYSNLDSLGRCGMAYEIVSKSILPTEERGQIGEIRPSGWQTVKYPDLIEDLYLYNRCHLIGYQLGGGNGDEQNLITGTRYLNVSGMLPFENKVTGYVEDTGNHVAYRVTPIFENNNLVASGVLMEAMSIEDDGAGVDFCIYAYNNQPGIKIDYATGDSIAEQSGSDPAKEEASQPDIVIPAQTADTADSVSRSIPDEQTITDKGEPAKDPIGDDVVYIPKSGKKYHRENCRTLKKTKTPISREEAISRGYEACKVCNP
ncbi:MAG: DNA/RNA non-specific endonuclease [Lachnospiraceae bacterium]|nr:DNA/RNA non-specific endonuclease [Lachnospiraceae bacterium]